ncbi:FG-GAP repeat domain-containing protein [Saltatorellus ferox]|uniref:FG-GAP repeat domain-containing protein n=1 Tax=Saltatorellus ferox TaxID=2528018 RepID=UPI003AF356E7
MVYSSPELCLVLNVGDGTFGQPSTIVPASGNTTDLRAADLDGDGAEDLVFMVSGRPTWMRSEGGGVFASPVVIGTSGGFLGWDIADMDGDGDPDRSGRHPPREPSAQ